VKVDPGYFRPTEVEILLGEPSKAKGILGWTPEITVEEMCAEMVENDLNIAKRQAFLKSHGHNINIPMERYRWHQKEFFCGSSWNDWVPFIAHKPG
jgi:GDPmannose 4,6-dehydratase